MTENNEYTQITDTERELRDNAISALRTTHPAWYGDNFEGWSTQQIKTVERIFRKVSVPLAEVRTAVNGWLEDNKSDYNFNPTLIELFEALEEPLDLQVTVEESIDLKISVTVDAERKIWVDKKTFVEELIENLHVGDITGDDVTGFSLSDVEEDN